MKNISVRCRPIQSAVCYMKSVNNDEKFRVRWLERLSIVSAKRNIIFMFKTDVLSCFVTQMHAFDAKRRIAVTRNKRNVLSFGASAIIHFITAVWNCGSNKTTGALSVNRSGQFSVLVNDHAYKSNSNTRHPMFFTALFSFHVISLLHILIKWIAVDSLYSFDRNQVSIKAAARVILDIRLTTPLHCMPSWVKMNLTWSGVWQFLSVSQSIKRRPLIFIWKSW